MIAAAAGYAGSEIVAANDVNKNGNSTVPAKDKNVLVRQLYVNIILIFTSWICTILSTHATLPLIL